MDITEWRNRCLAMQSEGSDVAGRIGASCPDCYKSIPAAEACVEVPEELCQCGNRCTSEEILQAHGLSELAVNMRYVGVGEKVG